MASIISAGTTDSTSLNISGDKTGILQLASNNAVTAVTIDGSQNVGIGTTSPSYKLDVQGITANQRISSTTGTNAAYQIFSNTGQNFYVGLDNSAGNQILSAAYGATLLGTGAYPMVFGTNNVERMRIDTPGNVGIGTSSPSVNANQTSLTINGTNNSRLDMYVGNTNTAGFVVSSTASYLETRTAYPLIFVTNAIERMRIDSSGNVGIGTTSNNSAVRLSVLGTPAAWSDNGIFEVRGSGAGNGARLSFGVSASTSGYGYIRSVSPGLTNDNLSLNPDGGRVLINTTTGSYTLTCNGQPGANGYTAWVNYSDVRLKENIETFYPAGSLSKVLQLRPVTFNYNELSGHDEATRARRISGFIAQELQPIYPEMVGTTKINGTEYFDTNTSDLTLHLVKAIQELKAINDTQAETINALTARLEALENK